MGLGKAHKKAAKMNFLEILFAAFLLEKWLK